MSRILGRLVLKAHEIVARPAAPHPNTTELTSDMYSQDSNGHHFLNEQIDESYFRGGFDSAISICHRAIREEPEWADAYSILADILLACGKEEEASRAYRQAILVNPDRNEFRVKLQEITGKPECFMDSLVCWIGDTPIKYHLGV